MALRTALVVSCLALSGVASAQSFSNLSTSGVGDSIFATGGPIIATFEGAFADYNSNLRLVVSSSNASSAFVMPNHATPVGTTFDFGSSFAAGTPLTFQLQVVNTGDTFVTGPAANNPDNVAHAAVVTNFNGTGRTLVGFEDMRGGGDKDFNDYVFSLTSTSDTAPATGTQTQTNTGAGSGGVSVSAVPESEDYVMIAFGLLAIGWLGRRRPRA